MGTGAPIYDPPGFAAIMTLALEHSFYSGRSLWQLILGGVFERFAGLRVAFVETEADWIAPAIRKLDRRLEWGDDGPGWAKVLQRQRTFSRSACEYWAENCTSGISPLRSIRFRCRSWPVRAPSMTTSPSAATTRCSVSTTRISNPSSPGPLNTSTTSSRIRTSPPRWPGRSSARTWYVSTGSTWTACDPTSTESVSTWCRSLGAAPVAPRPYLPSGVVDASSAEAAIMSSTTCPYAAVDGLSASPYTTRAYPPSSTMASLNRARIT